MKQAQDRLAAKQKEHEQAEKELRSLPRAAELEQAEQEIASGETALAELRAQEAELAGAPAQAGALAAAVGGSRRPAPPLCRGVGASAAGGARAGEDARDEVRHRRAPRGAGEHQARLAQYADVDAALDAVSVELQTYADAYQAVLSHQRGRHA